MKLGYCSDIHLEHLDSIKQVQEYLLALKPEEKLDVMVFAGDICNMMEKSTLSAIVKIVKTFATSVIYVDGNHEWYGTGSNLDRSIHLRHLQNLGVVVLSRFTQPEVTIDGQHFCGTMFWYPCNDWTRLAVETWSDNRAIDSFKKWWPGEYEIELKILNRIVTDQSIVVTHCLPCWEALHPTWVANPNNHFFVSPAIDIIQWNEPKAWIYGHAHTPNEQTIFKTRLLSNPIGYPRIEPERKIKVIEL
jgi:hypothetical protein